MIVRVYPDAGNRINIVDPNNRLIFQAESNDSITLSIPDLDLVGFKSQYKILYRSKTRKADIKIKYPDRKSPYNWPQVPDVKHLIRESDRIRYAAIKRKPSGHVDFILVNPNTFGMASSIERNFMLLHEIGHCYYAGEEDCDLFALHHMTKLGWDVMFFVDEEFNILDGIRGKNHINHELK